MTLVRNYMERSEKPDDMTRCEWLVIGPPHGAVQYVEWRYPDDSPVARIIGDTRQPVDVGYHSTKQRWKGQDASDCDVIEGRCYYDGSGLHAEHVRELFDRDGEEALWEYLERYFVETFEDES